MKKRFLLILFVFSIAFAKAQDVSHATFPATSALPEAHDWSIGFDVVPVIRSFGNLFHAPTGNDSVYSQNQFTLVALHVKNENTAYRFKLRIGFGSVKHNNLVTDDANPTMQLTDTWTENNMNITLG